MKNLRWSALAFVALTASVFACTSSTESVPDDSTADDEVTTAKCPASFTLDLAKPEIFRRTPSKTFTGAPLSQADKDRVAAAMTQARRFRKINFSFQIDRRSNARCSYKSSQSSAANAPKAVLRGPTAKPIIDITFGDFGYYAFPKSYTEGGFTFKDGASAAVLSGGVKIGNADIEPGAAPPSGPDAIGRAVGDLEGDAIFAGPGRNDEYPVTGSSALDLVKSYITAKYAEDPEMGAEYTFKENASGLETDVQVAGTISKEKALAEVASAIEYWYDQDEPNVRSARITKAKAAIEAAAAAGAKFGFDGFEQHGCAAPTPFLLVIDPARKMVYGIDMNPCSES